MSTKSFKNLEAASRAHDTPNNSGYMPKQYAIIQNRLMEIFVNNLFDKLRDQY